VSPRDPDPLAAPAHPGACGRYVAWAIVLAIALEIELAAFPHAGALAGISCAGTLVVSDTTGHTLRDDRVSRDERIIRVFQAVHGMWSESLPS
jgi:hypothetical protein